MAPVTIEVQTSVFEGPFDLLLHLILRDQVDLYEVNLSSVVDEYLRVLETLEHLDLEVTTEFLLTESATTPDEEVLDEAFFRKYKNMSEPDKKKIRKILDAWEDE